MVRAGPTIDKNCLSAGIVPRLVVGSARHESPGLSQSFAIVDASGKSGNVTSRRAFIARKQRGFSGFYSLSKRRSINSYRMEKIRARCRFTFERLHRLSKSAGVAGLGLTARTG